MRPGASNQAAHRHAEPACGCAPQLRSPRCGPTRAAALIAVTGLLLVCWYAAGALPARAAMTEEEQARVLRALRPSVTLQFSEADVNAYMKAEGNELGLPGGLEAPRVAFAEGAAELSARKKLGFLVPTRLRITVRPRVRSGKLVLEPAGGRAGKLLLPKAFRTRMADALGRFIAERLDTAGFDLHRVEVHKGTLTVHGKLRPTAADARQ